MAKSQLILSEGEEIKCVIEGEMWATSTNWLMNIILMIQKFLSMLIGVRLTCMLVITNKRIVVEKRSLIWWVLPSAASFDVLLPQSIASVSYAFVATFCCCLCRKYIVSVTQNSGSGIGVTLKGGAQEAAEIVEKILAVLVK